MTYRRLMEYPRRVRTAVQSRFSRNAVINDDQRRPAVRQRDRPRRGSTRPTAVPSRRCSLAVRWHGQRVIAAAQAQRADARTGGGSRRGPESCSAPATQRRCVTCRTCATGAALVAGVAELPPRAGNPGVSAAAEGFVLDDGARAILGQIDGSETPALDDNRKIRFSGAPAAARLLEVLPSISDAGVEVGGCSATRATARCACNPPRIAPRASTSATPAAATKRDCRPIPPRIRRLAARRCALVATSGCVATHGTRPAFVLTRAWRQLWDEMSRARA